MDIVNRGTEYNMCRKAESEKYFLKHKFVYTNKIAHWADEFSTDAFGKVLPIICKCRLSKKKIGIKF